MPNEHRAIRSRLDFSKIPTAIQIPISSAASRRWRLAGEMSRRFSQPFILASWLRAGAVARDLGIRVGSSASRPI